MRTTWRTVDKYRHWDPTPLHFFSQETGTGMLIAFRGTLMHIQSHWSRSHPGPPGWHSWALLAQRNQSYMGHFPHFLCGPERNHHPWGETVIHKCWYSVREFSPSIGWTGRSMEEELHHRRATPVLAQDLFTLTFSIFTSLIHVLSHPGRWEAWIGRWFGGRTA